MESFCNTEFDRVWLYCDFAIGDFIFLRQGIDKKLFELAEFRNEIDISTTLSIYSN